MPHLQTGGTGDHDLAKLGNIVAETLLQMQMFPSLAARETCVAETKNVFGWSQKHFCFPDTNFASETCVSQFSQPGKHKGLVKLGNIVAETLLRMQMFPSLAARETCVAETYFAAWKTKNVFACSQNIFASRTQILRPKHMFPSLATRET